MAHVHAYGDVAPLAKANYSFRRNFGFCGDNTDLIQIRDGLQILKNNW